MPSHNFATISKIKFAVGPRSSADFHQPLPQGMGLRNVFCLEQQRTVGNDWVVRYKSRFFQIKPQSKLSPATRKVLVQEHLDGSIHLVYRDRGILFIEIKKLPHKSSLTHQKQQIPVLKKKYVPPLDRPWRRYIPQPQHANQVLSV